MTTLHITAVTRYRVTVQLPDRPDIRKRITFANSCTRCAVQTAEVRASAIDEAWKLDHGTTTWTLERLGGVVDGWVQIARSGALGGVRNLRHACR